MNFRWFWVAVRFFCVAHCALATTPRKDRSEPAVAPTRRYVTRFAHERAASHGRHSRGRVFHGSVARYPSLRGKPDDDTSMVQWDEGSKFSNRQTVQSRGTHNFRIFKSALQDTGRWSILNLFVVVPLALVGIPAAIVAGDLYKKDKDVWTPEQSDLRVVDIADLGASGMVLLRESPHRKFGIMISFAGMLMKTILLMFLLLDATSSGPHEGDAPLVLLWCSIFFHTTMCAADFITGLKAWRTESPEGYEWIHQIIIAYDSFGITLATILIGSLWLCTSWSIADLVLNATAVGWITSINKQFASIMSWSISAHEGRAFVPNQVRVYDAMNSMKYAAWILCSAAVWALVMVVFTMIRW